MKCRLLLILLPLILTTGGCRNPFDPSADVKLLRFFWQGNLFVTLTRSNWNIDLASSGQQQVEADFANYTTVPGRMTSYSVVYRQLTAQPAPVNLPAGSPIPSLGGAAGRRFYAQDHIEALTDNTSGAGFAMTQTFPRILTAELFYYIGGTTGASTIGGGIDCEIVFFGEDDNGHEIRVGGLLHVEIN